VRNTTDFLAAWGAAVATIVAAWNLYRDFLKRDRVQVEAGLHFWSLTGEKVFFLKVLNRSSHNISVTHCVGYDKQHMGRWMQRLLKRHPSGYLFPFETLNKIRLPAKIGAWEHELFLYRIDTNFPTGDFAVITADNRTRFCPHSNIRAIHKDEAYKKIHSSSPPTQ
jgi:hypothetical protein